MFYVLYPIMCSIQVRPMKLCKECSRTVDLLLECFVLSVFCQLLFIHPLWPALWLFRYYSQPGWLLIF